MRAKRIAHGSPFASAAARAMSARLRISSPSGFSVNAVSVGVAVQLALEGLLAGVVSLVAGVNSLGVALERVLAVNDGVLAGEVGLVEIVGVLDVAAAETRLESERSVRANEHGNAASTASGSGGTLLVESNVTSDDDCVAAVPC